MLFFVVICKKLSLWGNHLALLIRRVLWYGLQIVQVTLWLEIESMGVIWIVILGSQFVTQFVFKRSHCDHFMFFKDSHAGKVILVVCGWYCIIWQWYGRHLGSKHHLWQHFVINDLRKTLIFPMNSGSSHQGASLI